VKIEQLKPSAEVLSLMAEITTSVDAGEAHNAAINRIVADEKTAQEQHDAMAAERASILAKRALQTDPTEVRSFGSELEKLAKSMAEAKLHLESIQIARAQLERELEEIEARIRNLREDGTARRTSLIYAGDVASDLYSRIEAAVAEHVLPLVLEAAALHAAMLSPEIAGWLNDLRVPLLGMGEQSLLTGSVANFTGERLMISDAWRDNPELVAEHEFASQVRTTTARLGQYVMRKQRMAVVEPYVRRGWTTGGDVGERTAAAAAARAQQEPSAPARREVVDPNASTKESAAARRFRVAAEGDLAANVLNDPDLQQFR
jgi:hypothetical protein